MSQPKPLPPLPEIELGTYRHYKTHEVYRVTAVARHSETLEPIVVYETLDGKEKWLRPHTMFIEQVEYEGNKVARFARM